MQMHADEIALVLWTPMFLFSSPQCMDLLCSRTKLGYILDCSSMDPSGGIVGPNGTLSNTTTKKNCHFELRVLSWPTSSNALVFGGCDEVEPSVPLWLPIILPTIRMIFCLVYGPYFYVDFLLQWSLFLFADIVSLLFLLAYLSVCLSVFRSFAVMNLLVVIFIFG